MAIRMPKLSKRRFNVDEYHRMGEAGIFDEDSNVELLDGVVWEMHPPRKHRFTVEEYNCLIETDIFAEDDQVELIEGEIVEMSPIGKLHAACVDRLTALFSRYAGQSAIVRVQNPIQLPDYSQPQPDVALLRPRDDFYAKSLPIPADVFLVVEVAETSLKYDQTVKVPLYARAGISEAWLVDLKNEVVEVYALPVEGKYQVIRRVGRGETIVVRDIPGLSVGVGEIVG
jgi:Uma2 family endonuclease